MTGAATLTRDLGGKWLRRYGSAPCPCCQAERRRDQRALTLADGCDGRLLAHCKKSGCSFRDILAAAGIRFGDYCPPDPAIIAQRERADLAQANKRARQAERCWQEALPIEATPAERYLRTRRIICDLPGTLRYHPSCWHVSGKPHRALIALIEGANGFAVHRTYLSPDGGGKAGLDGGDKLMLGAVAGGAVRLVQAQGPLLVAEGIETALKSRKRAAGPLCDDLGRPIDKRNARAVPAAIRRIRKIRNRPRFADRRC